MALDRPTIKQRAKEIIAASNPRVITVGMLYLLLTVLVEWLGQRVLSVNVSESEAMNYLVTGMWWLALMPGVCLLIVVILFEAIGNNLKLLIDPFSAQE